MEIITPGQGANGGVTPPSHPTTIDSGLLIQHLISLLEITLGASKEDLEGKGNLLSDAKRGDTVQRCLRFASEAQVALYVQKDAIHAEISNGLPHAHVGSGRELAWVAPRRKSAETAAQNLSFDTYTRFPLRSLPLPQASPR